MRVICLNTRLIGPVNNAELWFLQTCEGSAPPSGHDIKYTSNTVHYCTFCLYTFFPIIGTTFTFLVLTSTKTSHSNKLWINKIIVQNCKGVVLSTAERFHHSHVRIWHRHTECKSRFCSNIIYLISQLALSVWSITNQIVILGWRWKSCFMIKFDLPLFTRDSKDSRILYRLQDIHFS